MSTFDNGKGRGRKSRLTPQMATSAAPVFDQTVLDLGTTDWTTGDTISFSIADALADQTPIGYTSYALNTTETGAVALPLNVTLNTTTGLLSGLIADQQGGDYNLFFDATNLKGTTTSSLTVTVVDLEITAPTFNAVSNDLTIEVGEAWYLNLDTPTYLIQDGDPSGVSAITYAETGNNLSLFNIVLQPVGAMWGSPSGAQAQTTITIVGTNAAGIPSADITFDLAVVETAGVVAPTFVEGWTGELECGVGVPTWHTPLPTSSSYITGATLTNIDLNTYVSDNNVAISAFAYSTGGDSNGISLDTSTGIISGATLTGTATWQATFIATNAQGPSVASSQVTITIAAAVAPVVERVEAIADTNTITVTLSEACSATDVANGFSFKVNADETRNIVSTGGDGTASHTFVIDGAAFSENQYITVAYDQTAPADTTGDTSSLELTTLALDSIFFYVKAIYVGEAFRSVYNFNGGTIGAVADTHISGFTNVSPRNATGLYQTRFSAGPPGVGAHSGGVCADCHLTVGGGYEEWGGTISFNDNFQPITTGGELWIRYWWWWPASIEWSADPHSKGLRIPQQLATGGSKYIHDIYPAPDSIQPLNATDWSKYVADMGGEQWMAKMFPGPAGQGWECIEIYIKMSSISGQGDWKTWRNGVFHKESTAATLSIGQPDNFFHKAIFFTFFTGLGSPIAQSVYLDDVIITNSREGLIDDGNGNLYIGPDATS